MMAATDEGNGGAVEGDSETHRAGRPDDEVPTEEGSSLGSSQLISGPVGGGGSATGMKGWGSHAPDDLSIGDCTSNASYFILDEGGRHVLDDQGSPARARKWQPVNAQQRERYTRLHLATKGPKATCRWLPSVLVSPDHLRVPRARAAKDGNSIKGLRLGGAGSSFVPGFTQQQQQITPGNIINSGSLGEEEEGKLGEERRREIEVAKKRRRFLVEERRRTRPKQLDGFMLVDACGCDLPDEGRRADVSGRGLVSVVREDMSFFVRLHAVDAGDNSLPFDSFVDLPRLDELRLPCNSIRDIDVPSSLGQQHPHQQQLGGATISGYIELRRLDLSYNGLSGDALSALARLPSLTELDLTCNGLTELPKAMGRFPRLQKLSLERNQLESDSAFDVLSKLPALRDLNLAFNYFTGVKLRPEAVECAFPLLEALDLGFNYIGNESDVVVVVLFERLQTVILYGNPLAGPTGEDSLGLCVENLVVESDRIRADDYVSYPIEFITELPRTKQARGGGGGGGRRRRPYGDIGVTMVDEGYLPPAAAFRDAGNQSLFRFERRSACGENGGAGSADTIVEATLRSARESNDRAATAASASAAKKAAAAEAQDLTFLTAIERQEDQEGGGDAAEGGRLLGHDPGGVGRMSTRLLQGPVDPLVRGDPVKLRMALTALRHTLKHPVTSSMDVPWKQQHRQQQQQQQNGLATTNNTPRATASSNSRSKDKDSGVGRKTAAARARQLPRRPYRLLKGHNQPSYCAGLLDGPRKEGDVGGRGGLGRVDEVLTSMGAGMDAMVLEKQASQNNNNLQQRKPELSSIIRTVNAVLDENEY